MPGELLPKLKFKEGERIVHKSPEEFQKMSGGEWITAQFRWDEEGHFFEVNQWLESTPFEQDDEPITQEYNPQQNQQ